MSAGRRQVDHEANRDLTPDAKRRRARRLTIARLLLVATVAVALGSMLLLLAGPDREGVTKAAARTTHVAAPVARPVAARVPAGLRERAKLPQAEVAIPSRPGTIAVPRSFFGISTEYWSLPLFERQTRLFEKALSLLHVPGDGPLVLRIGGDSADHTFWAPMLRRVPPWVFRVTQAWFRQTSTIVRRDGVSVIVDLNLVTDSPAAAARLARAAEAGLPRRSIAGFEIGNEPDIYSRRYWLAATSRMRLAGSVLPVALSRYSYIRDFQTYARVLSKVAPKVPLVGPAIAYSTRDEDWISSLLAAAHPGLGIVSAHRYPYSACVDRRSRSYPTIARLLSEHPSAGIAQAIGPAVRAAHRAGLPFRLTELNSVTCGGRRGVSDAFATALWAPDALFELLRAGVDGVNVHIRATAINTPFTLSSSGLTARPLLYGLILFARTLGRDPRLVQLQLHARPALHLKAWAVRVRGGALHVLVIDKGNASVNVRLRLPAKGPATVTRLLAPSVGSRSGVTLAGQQLTPDGSWQGQPARQTIRPGVHGYELTIPRFSAALVDVHLRPGALAPATGRAHA